MHNENRRREPLKDPFRRKSWEKGRLIRNVEEWLETE